MRWLRDRIHGRRRNQRPEQPAGEQPSPEPPVQRPEAPNFARPRLVLLVRDAAGPAAYQLHSFEDEAEAASFVQFWFPSDGDHGVIAFWASHSEPEVEIGERSAEVVVLVRDETRSKSVCPFSFPGMDLAQSWVARESDRGLELHPDHVLIYWAAPARISRDHWGRVHFWPSEPPALRPHGRRATLTAPAFHPNPTSPRPAAAWAPKHQEAPSEERLEPAEVETVAELLAEAGEVGSAANDAAQAGEVPAIFEETAELFPETPAGEEPVAFEEAEPVSDDEALEPSGEIDRLLRRRRWEQQKGPFRGFGSPPGKF